MCAVFDCLRARMLNYTFACLLVRLVVCLSVYMCACVLFVCLSVCVCLFACLVVCVLVWLLVCLLFACLSVCVYYCLCGGVFAYACVSAVCMGVSVRLCECVVLLSRVPAVRLCFGCVFDALLIYVMVCVLAFC